MNNPGLALREQIYALICGDLEIQEIERMKWPNVKSEFGAGSECSMAYGRMLDAYSSICRHLGAENV